MPGTTWPAANIVVGSGSLVATPVYTAVASSNNVRNPGRGVILHVKNGSGGSVNVTLVGQANLDGAVIQSKVVAVPAGAERHIYVNPALYNYSDGTFDVNFSATASVTMAVLDAA